MAFFGGIPTPYGVIPTIAFVQQRQERPHGMYLPMPDTVSMSGASIMCANCGQRGHASTHCTNPSRDTSGFIGPKMCTTCRRSGHTCYECPSSRVMPDIPRPVIQRTVLHCTVCGNDGHTSDRCYMRHVCDLCGNVGHMESRCYRNHVCDICHETGHMEDHCTRQQRGVDNTNRFRAIRRMERAEHPRGVCARCTCPGHDSAHCRMNIDLFCERCVSYGHVARDCHQNIDIFCSSCSHYGHTADTCRLHH